MSLYEYFTNMKVKGGISCKVKTNSQKEFVKIVFDFLDFNFNVDVTSRNRRSRVIATYVSMDI